MLRFLKDLKERFSNFFSGIGFKTNKEIVNEFFNSLLESGELSIDVDYRLEPKTTTKTVKKVKKNKTVTKTKKVVKNKPKKKK